MLWGVHSTPGLPRAKLFWQKALSTVEHTFSGGRVPEHSAGAGVQGCRSTYALCQMDSKNAKEKIPLSLRGSSTVEFPRKNLSELFFLHVIKFSLVYSSWMILNLSVKTFPSYSGLLN